MSSPASGRTGVKVSRAPLRGETPAYGQQAEKVVGSQAHADASETLGVCPIQAAAQSCHQLTPGSGPPFVPSACQDFDFVRLFPFTDFRHLAFRGVQTKPVKRRLSLCGSLS